MIHAKLIRNGDFSKTIELNDEQLQNTLFIPIINGINHTVASLHSYDALIEPNIISLEFYLDDCRKVGNITFATYREK